MSKNPSSDLLEDLSSRFVLNVPASEFESFDRFMFLVEQAHWFYEDHCRLEDPSLKSISLMAFTGLLFGSCPGLESYKSMLPQIQKSFTAFKSLVPTFGAILLSNTMEHCLLVRGYHKHATWGFPKGKIASNETQMACAIREVQEETSYNIAPKIVESDFVETHLGGRGEDRRGSQHCKLFIIQEVDTKYAFHAKCKGEIGAYGWFAIKDLPTTLEAARMMFSTSSDTSYKMHNVVFFTQQLRSWIARKQKKNRRVKNKAVKQSAVKEQGAKLNGDGLHAKTNEPKRANSSGSLKAGSDVSSPGVPANGASANGIKANWAPSVSSVPEPGQSWLNFKFNAEHVLEKLTTPTGV